MTIRLRSARIILLGLFAGCLTIAVLLIGMTYLRGVIYGRHLQQLVLAVLSVYSAPLGTILGGIFAQRQERDRAASSSAFWIAIVVALIWNLLLLVRVVIFAAASNDRVDDFTGYLTSVAAASSFLVVGSLAFYFTKREGTQG